MREVASKDGEGESTGERWEEIMTEGEGERQGNGKSDYGLSRFKI